MARQGERIPEGVHEDKPPSHPNIQCLLERSGSQFEQRISDDQIRLMHQKQKFLWGSNFGTISKIFQFVKLCIKQRINPTCLVIITVDYSTNLPQDIKILLRSIFLVYTCQYIYIAKLIIKKKLGAEFCQCAWHNAAALSAFKMGQYMYFTFFFIMTFNATLC